MLWPESCPGEFGKMARIVYTRSHPGVVRGMHYQSPGPMGKFVRCVRGRVFDVVVDVRQDSPGYGQWRSYILSEDVSVSLWVPRGFAHGFQSMTASGVLYLCDEQFLPACDQAFSPLDPRVGIAWPQTITGMSDRDRQAPPLNPIEPFNPDKENDNEC